MTAIDVYKRQVFTIDEEIGMGGAHHLDTSVLKGKICLNIDSEIEGVMTVGCAGGYIYDTFIPIEWSEEMCIRDRNHTGFAVPNLLSVISLVLK